jgi:hypothetical protein
VALCPQDVTLAIVLVVYRPYASAVLGTMHCSWTPLWECMPRSEFNTVAAQQSTKDRNLQDCNTIALSLEYMHHSCCSGENRSVIHSCHSWVDTSLCQRCEVVVLSSGMPTALCPLFKVPERSPTARPNQDFRANFFEDRQLLFDL